MSTANSRSVCTTGSCTVYPDPWQPTFLLLTCEHGGYEVPAEYKRLFRGAGETLATHRGYDIGALGVALRMAALLAAPTIFSTITRLLIDLNRSIDHPGVYSEFTRGLEAEERASIAEKYYTPHRTSVTKIIHAAINDGHRVLHVGIHSCTDILEGEKRELDVSLLFDPDRANEQSVCTRWRDALTECAGSYRYPFNKPYLGTDDGLVTTLRAEFSSDVYAGVEVEVRQGMIQRASDQSAIGDLLAASLRACGLV